MISKIHGVLESVSKASAKVSPSEGITYEVLLPAFASARVNGWVGRPVTFHTVHYLEGSTQGGNLIPRLAGFLEETDREFYTLFTSVKGIGARKALRAMAMSTAQIATAIADRDLKTIQTLPEIGRRMAETIVATLHGKVDRFVSESTYADKPDGEAIRITASGTSASRAALEILLQLGENRAAAVQWIDQVLVKQPDLSDATRLVQEVLKLKSGV